MVCPWVLYHSTLRADSIPQLLYETLLDWKNLIWRMRHVCFGRKPLLTSFCNVSANISGENDSLLVGTQLGHHLITSNFKWFIARHSWFKFIINRLSTFNGRGSRKHVFLLSIFLFNGRGVVCVAMFNTNLIFIVEMKAEVYRLFFSIFLCSQYKVAVRLPSMIDT